MVLPTSGSLSYNTIRAEFGSPSSNVYLSLYYRGGPYTYNVPRNSSITTSTTGSIAVNDFYGAAGKGDYAGGPLVFILQVENLLLVMVVLGVQTYLVSLTHH